MIMAWAILKSLGAPAAVSSAELDGTTGKIVAATGCEITDAKAAAGAVTFTRKDAALPMPVNLKWKFGRSCYRPMLLT